MLSLLHSATGIGEQDAARVVWSLKSGWSVEGSALIKIGAASVEVCKWVGHVCQSVVDISGKFYKWFKQSTVLGSA